MISFGVLKENSLATRIWRKVNKVVWENSVAVFTIGDVMGERLESQFQPSKTVLKGVGIIPPWADTDNIQPIKKEKNPLTLELKQGNCITVLYSGNMGISHDIDSMLKAAKLLNGNEKIKFLFIGEGEKWQSAFDFVKEHGLDSVQVLPFQPEEKLPYTMALGDISLVALDKGAEGLMVPSKMYYYMAAGSAVLGICQGENDLQRSINKACAGMVVEPGNPRELANTILMLAKDENLLTKYKTNARKGSVAFYSRKSCMDSLVHSFKNINLIL
jgi:glycosyltransferase involved in cell wall biosynthesis